MSVVVDTDVISFIRKQDTRAPFYETQLIGLPNVVVSFMTVAELEVWALRRRWGPARVSAMERYLQQTYVMVSADRDLCRLWAQVTDDCRRAGRPIQSPDAWIAATALQYGIPLLTHNHADFAAVPGLAVIADSA